MKLINNLYFYPEHGIFNCNSYVITGEPGILIDPGSIAELPALLGQMQADGISPESIGIITNTHLHGDHCGANDAAKQATGAEIRIHPVQKQHYQTAVFETAELFGLPPMEFHIDGTLDNGRLGNGSLDFTLITTPGHSPDCVCFYDSANRVLVCGDVVFAQSTGRVDLPGGNADQLRESIGRLAELDIEYLLPGHMDIISGAANVSFNFDLIENSILKWL